MPNDTIVTPDDMATITATVGNLTPGKDFACDTPELRRIFGPTTLGRVLVLEMVETRKGMLVRWQ